MFNAIDNPPTELTLPDLPYTPYELSMRFQSTVDLNPVKVEICFSDSEEQLAGLHGVLISPYIGAKVFLHTFTSFLGYAPTKVRIFMASKDP